LPNDSDALTTLPMADTDRRAALPFHDPDATDHIARTSRTRWAIAAVVAVALATSWALLRGDSSASAALRPQAQGQTPALVPAPTVIELPEPPAQPAHVVAAPEPPAPVDVPAEPSRERVPATSVECRAGSRPVHVASTAAATATATTDATTTAPAIEASPAKPSIVDESAAAVAARYHAIGNALHARGTDELWQQYRRIQLGDAMATAESRHAALTTLDVIEHALPAS
jgi:hypothetical protein